MKNVSITKDLAKFSVTPNLTDYEQAYADFSWDAIRQNLAGLPNNQGLNIAYEAIDRHATGAHTNHTAIRWLAKDGERLDITYAQLNERSNRFANVLKGMGITKGDRVFSLCGRIPDFFYALLGTLKNISVFCPLYTAFGPKPIGQRLEIGAGKVLVTNEQLYRRKVAGLLSSLPTLTYVLITDCDTDLDERVLSLPRLLKEASPEYSTPPTDPGDMALLHFTSGTTGRPKGVIHVHEAVLSYYVNSRDVLDLHPEDTFWCTAESGWVTRTISGAIEPLLHGVTNIVIEAEFEADDWCRTLAEERVSVWYTEPTAIRTLMRSGIVPSERYNLSALRLIHSVGEPLSPEAIAWGERALGQPIHDNWGQAETGGIMIGNYPAMEIRPGSMGRPLPGIEAAIVHRDAGQLTFVTCPDQEGELALRVGWPSMFRAYLGEEKRYRSSFVGDWYITGDLAKRDTDGYFWFVGRADDTIKTSGYMVGPFEVESTLLEHPAVAESGVIGIPEPTMGELVKAFVSLKPGFEASEELRQELLAFSRKHLGPLVAPKEIDFRASLPKTHSGKIMRRLLKATELGLPEGDISSFRPVFRDWAEIYHEALNNRR